MSDHPLPPGTRVRHYGQQYDEALEGTATVLRAEEQRDGTYEYLVQRDKPLMPGMRNEPTYWASYHTIKGMAFDV
jgi:hypothetical protein